MCYYLIMKRFFLLFLALLSLQMPLFAINFGSYKAETEYGIIDGFKWNFFNRDKDAPLVQIKSETKEEQERIEREKNKPKAVQDEVQMYKFMLDNTVVF